MEEPQWLTVEEAAAFCEVTPKSIENRTQPKSGRFLESKIENGIKYVLVSEADKRVRASSTQESYARLKEECAHLKHTITELREQCALKDTVIKTHAEAMARLEDLYQDKCRTLHNELGNRGKAIERLSVKKKEPVLARVLRSVADAIS